MTPLSARRSTPYPTTGHDHRARPAAAPAGVAGRAPARRAGPGRLPHAAAGEWPRLRRPAALRRRRRRPAHRLERHRPAGRAAGARVQRGPRADHLAGPRPIGVHGGRRPGPRQAGRARRARPRPGPAARPERQPGRRGAVRHRHGPASSRPAPDATRRCGSDGSSSALPTPERRRPPTSPRCSTPSRHWPGAASSW